MQPVSVSSQYGPPPVMHQAPQAPPPQHYQPIPQQYQQPPTQHAPPIQQSSIQIPVGPGPQKVVSTACIYPSQPGEAILSFLFFYDAQRLVSFLKDDFYPLQLQLRSHLSPTLQPPPRRRLQELPPAPTDLPGCQTPTSLTSLTPVRPPPT